MTQPKSSATETHATCPYCGMEYGSHNGRCLRVLWDGKEVRRCLHEADHEGVCAFRMGRSRREAMQ